MEGAIALAQQAGDRILQIYRRGYDVREKSDSTPVTDADMEAHYAICAGLDILTPDVPVVSEEADPAALDERRRWPWYWLIDPLDGTREFIRGSGEFTVNIALMKAGRPVLGVIHVPVGGATYFAASDAGAFHQHANGPPERIHARAHLSEPPVIAVSRARRGPRLHRFLNNLGPHQTVAMGSSLKSCLVAAGRADLYPCFGPTSEWDTAAAHCLIEQAGGRLTDLRMRPLRYNRRASMLNPPFFACASPDYDWSRFV